MRSLVVDHLDRVEVVDCVAGGPAGLKAEWEAEIINEVPNELFGWRSVGGSRVDNAGSVHFTRAAGGGGTEIKVILRYDPPAGLVGAAIARVFGEDPAFQVQEDLRRLKELVETGEVATVENQSTGREVERCARSAGGAEEKCESSTPDPKIVNPHDAIGCVTLTERIQRDAPQMDRAFRDKQDESIKVVMRPQQSAA